MRLQGHRAVVTGAAGGIGKACAVLFESEGAHVTGLDIASGCDVRSRDSVEAAARHIEEPPDILVNCAAATAFADTLNTTEEDFERIMQVNVWGAINVCQVFAPKMISGSIVNVSSITGIVGAPGLSAYSASKGALITLTRTLALELAERNIRVNCICPASIDTPMLQASFNRHSDPQHARELNIRRHPLGRLGTPEDVAKLALFLASDDAAWITGGTYVIDGGA
ncbi:MAG: SDR family NAD(P)-dependent oxidoreductase, partial [Bryobacteraceae bacterium]